MDLDTPARQSGSCRLFLRHHPNWTLIAVEWSDKQQRRPPAEPEAQSVAEGPNYDGVVPAVHTSPSQLGNVGGVGGAGVRVALSGMARSDSIRR